MSKAPRNVLDIKRKLQLSKYLENNAGELRDLTIEQIATRAAADNGFPVTPANVVFLRDTFDLDIGKARQLPPPARDFAKEIDEIKAAVADIIKAIRPFVYLPDGRCRVLLESGKHIDLDDQDTSTLPASV